MINYGRQSISEEDIQAVVEVLKSDFLTQGETVPAFEKVVSAYTGANYSVAVNSGTSALHIACMALELQKGDWLWTTPISFVASANCGLYCGAQVDFVDIDPGTWNLSVAKLEEKLKVAKQQNRIPKILVVVHFTGLPCDMESIHLLSQEYGFNIIEDACHALGGKYKDEQIGCCRYSDITVFSFHPVKSITTGEGGMAVTNNEKLAKQMELLRSHGITRDSELMTKEPDGSWYYQQVMLGYNYRLTDIQASLGISQMKRLDSFVNRRQEISNYYNKIFSDMPVQLQCHSDDYFSGLHLYVIRLQLDKIKYSHRQVFEALRENGIGVNLHYIPIHLQPYYQNMNFREGDYPVAEQYYKEAISLPIYPDLTNNELDKVVSTLKKCISH